MPKVIQDIVVIKQYNDQHFIQQALELAHQGEQANEVPVGALVVQAGEVIGQGYNQPISSNDPTAHAEIVAMRQAAQVLDNYRLLDTTLYVTLEPCAMCLSAMLHARIKRLVFAAYDPRAGAVQSVFKLLDEKRLNHRIEWQGGILAEPCGLILKEFFKKRRLKS
jgi:tRNA(adenine34) deaminase